MRPKLYKIKKSFAEANNLPIIFVANMTASSNKAIKLTGRCMPQTRGYFKKCFLCSEDLKKQETHIGICQKCGDIIGGWESHGGYSLRNIKKLHEVVQNILVEDQWVPKSVIKKELPIKLKLPKIQKLNDRKAVFIEGNIIASCDYDKVLVDQLKTLEGAVYQKRNKTWKIWPTTNSIQSLSIMGFKLCSTLKKLRNSKTPLPLDKIDYRKLQPIEHEGLLRQPYNFQSVGNQFITLKDGNAIVADDMGLGKTMQALSYVGENRNKVPVVIICPATLKYNWLNEIVKTLPNANVQVLSGKEIVKLTGDILIINYDILPNEYETYKDAKGKKRKREIPFSGWVDHLIKLKPKVLITDECHYYKNRDANRTEAVIKLAEKVKRVIQLSATPIENGPDEFYPALHIADPVRFSSYWDFTRRYCSAKKGRWGWTLGKPSNMEELHHRIDGVYMIRRLKEEVLTELPAKSFSFLPMDIDNTKEYKKAEQQYLDYLSELFDTKKAKSKKKLLKHIKAEGIDTSNIEEQLDNEFNTKKEEKLLKASGLGKHFMQLESLKQITAKGKLKGCIQWIKDFLVSGKKLVIFAEHTFIIDALLNEFSGIAVKIDGSISTGKKRQTIVDKFQDDPKIKIFISNKAGQEGLTLTAASDVLHVEYPWTPGALSQRSNRCHRIGQENPVTIHYAIARNTVDEKIAKDLDYKAKIISKIMDGKTPDSQSLITDLIIDYIKKL